MYCLLVIDGFIGHKSLEFIKYYIQFDIIICILPPHSTHLLQPLDLAVFQTFKNSQQKALRKSIRERNLAFTRLHLHFLEIYYDAFPA
jgi:hypothetical protein